MNAEQIEQLMAQRDARHVQLVKTRDAMLRGIGIAKAQETVAYILSKLKGNRK